MVWFTISVRFDPRNSLAWPTSLFPTLTAQALECVLVNVVAADAAPPMQSLPSAIRSSSHDFFQRLVYHAKQCINHQLD